MKLLIDIGNTRIKGALEEGGELHDLPAISYVDNRLESGLSGWGLAGETSGCWIASVGHASLCEQLNSWLQGNLGLSGHFVRSTARACGVTNAYAEPANLGVDRWLSLMAAHARGGPAVIVSAGTAATIDVINGEGQHLGGLITPGLSTLRKAMLDHTQVRANTDEQGLKPLGDSTNTCVTYGTMHSLIGYIEHTVAQLEQQDHGWLRLITGGDAELLLPHLEGEWKLAPNLVLEGLAILASDNGA